MPELDRILGEARDTHNAMQNAIRTSGDSTARDIARLRTRLATLIAEMTGAIKGDSRLQAKPDVAREFDVRFFEMRQALAQHQGKWRLANIDGDPVGYRRSTDEMGRTLDDFFGWANDTLGAL
jgi:hypothetical protein